MLISLESARGSIVEVSPKARTAYLSHLVHRLVGASEAKTLILKNPRLAAQTRDYLAQELNRIDGPLILVFDLDGITLTPSTLQELILPLAQRIRGGEHGSVQLVISSSDLGVADFVRYMAQVHQLPLYLCRSSQFIGEAVPIGSLTRAESSTLDAVSQLGGYTTASQLAEAEEIKANAAINRLVKLEREGYLIRRSRNRRQGDLYMMPQSGTASPIAYELSPHHVGGTADVPYE